VSKIRFWMPFSFLRIELILWALPGAPQPVRPEASIFQSLSVFATARSVATVCATMGIASATTAANVVLTFIVLS